MRILVATLMCTLGLSAMPGLEWRELPPLPHPLGGQFVGTVGDRLVVAGGSYWNRPPWQGGVKEWSDTIHVFDGKRWTQAGKLPQPLGYGVAVTIDGRLLLFGGQAGTSFSDRILLLTAVERRIVVREVGRLPQPMAMMSGVESAGKVYIAGGQVSSSPSQALRMFLCASVADLLNGTVRWQTLPVWNGPPRFFAQMGADSDSVFLVGGSDLKPGAVREFLNDAHRFTPNEGWQRLPDLPRAAQAGLGTVDKGRFCLFGGSDGTLSEALQEKHPGFRREVLCYAPRQPAWTVVGHMPASLVTTGLTYWRQEYIIAGGEDRPGHRSARVIAVYIKELNP